MSQNVEERVDQDVMRAVFWGEPREQVFRLMEERGISGYHADAIFRRAWRARLRALRGEGRIRLIAGMAILALAGCAFYALGDRSAWIAGRLFALVGLGAVWGLWWTLDGLTTILFAHMKKGSVSTEI